MSMNFVAVMGRLCADPELRTTPSGVSVCNFRLAVERDFKNKETGERETDFLNVQCWRNTADFVSRYFTKGRMAVCVGRLQTRNYTDKEGNKRTATDIIAENVYFGDSQRKEQTDSGDNGYQYSTVQGQEFKEMADDTGDFPF